MADFWPQGRSLKRLNPKISDSQSMGRFRQELKEFSAPGFLPAGLKLASITESSPQTCIPKPCVGMRGAQTSDSHLRPRVFRNKNEKKIYKESNWHFDVFAHARKAKAVKIQASCTHRYDQTCLERHLRGRSVTQLIDKDFSAEENIIFEQIRNGLFCNLKAAK